MSDLASAIGMHAEEQALVAELQAGSEQAFALLIAQYSRGVYSLMARSLKDPADAADATQDVFIKVFRSISSFHGEASLRTWIYRIALHEASNQRRWWSRHKKKELTIDAPLEARQGEDEGDGCSLADILASTAASPYQQAEQAERKSRVTAALLEMPECFRQVVILREIESFGYEEIAEMLQVNLGTVKSRLTRGRTALRAALLEQDRLAEALRAGVVARNGLAIRKAAGVSR